MIITPENKLFSHLNRFKIPIITHISWKVVDIFELDAIDDDVAEIRGHDRHRYCEVRKYLLSY